MTVYVMGTFWVCLLLIIVVYYFVPDKEVGKRCQKLTETYRPKGPIYRRKDYTKRKGLLSMFK